MLSTNFYMHRDDSNRRDSSQNNTDPEEKDGSKKQFIRVEVENNGKGMTTKEVDILTNQGFSCEGGVTYGLMVANMIIEAHDGIFGTFSDGPDKGSTFFIELPLASEEQIDSLPHNQNAYWV